MLSAQGKYEEAEKLLCDALAMSDRVEGTEHLDNFTCVENYAGTLSSQKRCSEAEPLYLRAYEGRKKRLGVDHPRTRHAFDRYQRARDLTENPNGQLAE